MELFAQSATERLVKVPIDLSTTCVSSVTFSCRYLCRSSTNTTPPNFCYVITCVNFMAYFTWFGYAFFVVVVWYHMLGVTLFRFILGCAPSHGLGDNIIIFAYSFHDLLISCNLVSTCDKWCQVFFCFMFMLCLVLLGWIHINISFVLIVELLYPWFSKIDILIFFLCNFFVATLLM